MFCVLSIVFKAVIVAINFSLNSVSLASSVVELDTFQPCNTEHKAESGFRYLTMNDGISSSSESILNCCQPFWLYLYSRFKVVGLHVRLDLNSFFENSSKNISSWLTTADMLSYSLLARVHPSLP